MQAYARHKFRSVYYMRLKVLPLKGFIDEDLRLKGWVMI